MTLASFRAGLAGIENEVVEAAVVMGQPCLPGRPVPVPGNAVPAGSTRARILSPRAALWEVGRIWVPLHIEHRAQLLHMQACLPARWHGCNSQQLD